MINHNQDGAVNGEGFSLVMAIVLLVSAIAFGAWAFSSRQDYKDNTDAKINVAVKTATAKESTVKDKQFAEQSKQPLTSYSGPAILGSIVFKYPKTWSGYVNSSGANNSQLDVYFNPVIVPSLSDNSSLYALHVQVVNQSYPSVLQSFAGQQQNGNLTVDAYVLPQLPKVIGAEISGTFSDNSTGTLVIMPLRSQTIEIETDGTQFVNDFNTYVLPNFTYSP